MASQLSAQFDRDGYVILSGLFTAAEAAAMLARAKELAALPPGRVARGARAVPLPERARRRATTLPAWKRAGKMFNLHPAGDGGTLPLLPAGSEGVFEPASRDPRLLAPLSELLGSGDLDCFLSQFIFKNGAEHGPDGRIDGAIGQPWHQDQYYFNINRAGGGGGPPPKQVIGVWVAVSDAAEDNGPLVVIPGSHREPVHPVGPDPRPGAQLGYVETRGVAGIVARHGAPTTVLMRPGDVLLFDGNLVHSSKDNASARLRAAMVYHYCATGAAFPSAQPIWEFAAVRRSDAALRGAAAPHRLAPGAPPRPPPPAAERRRVTARQAADFAELGFFVLRGALPAADIAAVRAALDAEEARAEAALRRIRGGRLGIAEAGKISFVPHAVTRSAACRDFSRHPVFRDLCHDLIGAAARPRLYWDQAVYKKPCPGREFPWHQDNGYTYLEPQAYLTCWVPLSDATPENGCPWVLPRVHRLGTLHHEWDEGQQGYRIKGLAIGGQQAAAGGGAGLRSGAGATPVCVPARAGDVVVFSSLTPHRTGPNETRDPRRAYILQYAPDGAEAVAAAARVSGGHAGAPSRARCDHPRRQYYVLGDAPASRL